MKTCKDISAYIMSYPRNVQSLLQKLRTAIKKAAPKAEEAIRYGIPTFRLHGNLVSFGAFKNHVSFFPGSVGIRAFKKELSTYEGARGTVRFPFNKPLPLGLIARITRFRVMANLAKAKKICSRGHVFYKSSDFPVCPKCWPGYYRKRSRARR